MAADRVHPMPSPSSSPLPPPPGRRRPPDHHQQPSAAADETTPLQPHPSFFSDDDDRHPLSPPPGTYIIQVPKDQVLREPPPDRARRYKKLAAGLPSRRRCLRRACCSLLLATLLLLAAAAFAGAVYLVYRPRLPSFSIASSLTIHGLLNLTSSSTTTTTLSPALDAAVLADNGRNKKVAVEYRPGGGVAVWYDGQRLAAGPWPAAFRQAARNVTVVAVAVRGKNARLTTEQRRRLAAERDAGAVPLTVEVEVPVRMWFGKVLRTWSFGVKARCEVSVDRLDGNATVVVDNRGCGRVRVKLLWWWW